MQMSLLQDPVVAVCDRRNGWQRLATVADRRYKRRFLKETRMILEPRPARARRGPDLLRRALWERTVRPIGPT